MRLPPILALFFALAACGGEPGGPDFGGMTQPGVTGAPDGSESSSAGSSTGEPASSTTTTPDISTGGDTSTGETVWDMGAPVDFGSVQPAGCQGKIDFLFVISADGHMDNDQGKLLAAFPEFMAAIEAQLPGFDFHILSANTNKNIDLVDCSVCTDSCDPHGEPPYCGAKFSLCDKTIGASVVFPTGEDASNRRCELDSGLRYITSGQQDLGAAFSCIAQVGTDGGSVAGQAMVEALAPAINDASDEDACNRGFLRDDALLVVTIIQGDYDDISLGTPDKWVAALRAAKHDDDDAFAVLVLTTDVDVGYGQLCWPDDFSPNKNRLRLLAEGVEHGFIGSICVDSFVPFFTEHVAHLAELCDDFVAPG